MLNRVSKSLPSLSLAEQRVAKWVLDNPHQVISSTLADIACATKVSEPTVVRFCRSVGSNGYRDFKVRLAQHLAATDHMVHADVSADDDATRIITKVIGRSVQELIHVQQRLNPTTLEAVADALLRARRLDFYGVGASGFVVSDAQNKFFRLGVPCCAYSDTPTILQAAAIADENYAVIVVSKTGDSSAIIKAATIARKNGATVIAVTSPLSPLAAAADLTLLIDVDEDTGTYTPMSSRLAQLAVLDVVQVAFALRLGDSGMAKLERSKNVLQNHRH